MTSARCFVLCAGLGSRLRPLTDETPKPLLWVYDRPQVEHVFEHLRAAGFTSCVINTHHLAERFSADWLARQPLAVEVAHEAELLGTGGGLVNAAQALGAGEVLLWNADMLGAPDLGQLLTAHRAKAVSATLLGFQVKSWRPTVWVPSCSVSTTRPAGFSTSIFTSLAVPESS